jgi:aryl-alcohol dehydrogenase-like predicted oxidoreductase
VPRDDVVLATKAGVGRRKGARFTDASRRHLIASLDASLERLGVEHVDLWQVHTWVEDTPLEETLSALDALVGTGKVRYIGSSNYTGWQLMKSLWISDRDGLESFVSQQIYYSLQARDAENELVPIAIDQNLGILVWSPLAGGLLSGKYRRGQEAPEGTRRFEGWTEPPVHDEDRLYTTVDALVAIGEEHGVSAAQVALAYTLAKPAVTSVIVGARTEEQLRDNLGAAELSLTEAELARLDDASAVPLMYPYWHQANTGPGRLGPADLSLLGRHLP